MVTAAMAAVTPTARGPAPATVVPTMAMAAVTMAAAETVEVVRERGRSGGATGIEAGGSTIRAQAASRQLFPEHLPRERIVDRRAASLSLLRVDEAVEASARMSPRLWR